jgi:Domain of Unknown Function (DUF1080)
MRYALFVPLLLSLGAVAVADDDPKPKPNTLTEKEAADGWLLLFDGESTFGWKALDDSKWTVLEGMLAPQGDKEVRLVSTTAFADYDLSLEYRMKRETKADVIAGCDADGRWADGKAMNSIPLTFMGTGWATQIVEVRGGDVTAMETITGNRRRRQTTGIEKPGGPQDRKTTSGYLALSGSNFIVRNIKLKPMNTQAIFNGKDLDNWKVFAGATPKVKSEFTVTKEGWIALNNGPGDLQSKDAWADFVLQIDCLSNGKELNSGVFFRCQPDEYQQGYEAQIHNGFTEKAEKVYKIEEYDPKTNELKETKEIKYAAKDYGTGAIYRRIPARREVAKDKEWFTMTVVAQGRHIATWVNGVQVVDWTDNRPVKDNARNGCKLDKGPISLQGHDPTTDLNFRNIQIAELPPLLKK